MKSVIECKPPSLCELYRTYYRSSNGIVNGNPDQL